MEEEDRTELKIEQRDRFDERISYQAGLLLTHEEQSSKGKRKRSIKKRFGMPNGNNKRYPILGRRLHFVKFEIGELNEFLDFIASKQLHRGGKHNALLFHYIMEKSEAY